MNDKVKSLFFSQYWGQKVLVFANDYKGNPITNELMEVTSFKQIEQRNYLLLRDISQQN